MLATQPMLVEIALYLTFHVGALLQVRQHRVSCAIVQLLYTMLCICMICFGNLGGVSHSATLR